MGFAYQKGQTRFYLAESTHNVAFRTTYLRKKLANRSDAGAPLLPEVYLDESFCNLNHSPGKTWVDETKKRLTKSGKGPRMCIVGAGIVRTASRRLVVGEWVEGRLSCGHLNSDLSENEKVKLTASMMATITMATSTATCSSAGSYHKRVLNPPPTSKDPKATLMAWLAARAVSYDAKITKAELLDLCRQHRETPSYATQVLATECGHTLLFTPPYHPELQPIEVVWGVVKNRIGVRPSKDMGELRTRLEVEFSSIESSHWLGAYRKAQSFEDMYFSTAEDALLGDEASDADSDLLRESMHHETHHRRSDSCPHVVGGSYFLPPPTEVVTSVRTVVRIRPLPTARSTSSNKRPWLRCRHTLGDKAVEVVGVKPTDNKLYMADHVLSEDATQEDVFTTVGAPAVDALVAGYNGSVIAYGQVGSGKTYTMHVECVVSFVEIHNEKIWDLLDVRAVDPKNIREDTRLNQVFVQDLVQVPVSSAADAIDWLEKGMKARKVTAPTARSAASSRGHGVFSIKLRQQLSDSSCRKTVLHCVDLAGSDKNLALYPSTAAKDLKEASHINKSLSCLVGVLSALVDVSSGVKRHVPYRDSKLTFLLREALGGNAKTTFVATVSSEDKWMADTLSTLQLVDRTTHVTSRVKVNDSDGVERMVQSLQREVATLKHSLAHERHRPDDVVVIPFVSPEDHTFKAVDEAGSAKERSASMPAQTLHEEKEALDPTNQVKRVVQVCSAPTHSDAEVNTDPEITSYMPSSSWERLPSMEASVVLFVVGYCVGRYFRP
ncbi:hypothetical protein DYB34_004471 [Aphanomyces astaci]|uniref:Kinesin motor domain-containing protein n=1 Tax=Aphanomyces astaci TaxID=112090 RepID=A0A3R7A6K8_APHAT|nr:hypothetical protein DYB34_004471 [Aphanomyces astaci]